MSARQLTLNVVAESDFLIEETETEVVITGTIFTLPPFKTNIWRTKNLTIRAYALTLTEDISVPGKNISIYAHKIHVANQLTLSVSGVNGAAYPTAAGNGRSPGAAGTHGNKGRPGSKAGNITVVAEDVTGQRLTLLARGGSGGLGQKGGNGAAGNVGSAGRDATSERDTRGNPGGKGQKGGDAGRGGLGGDAADGGNIELRLPFSQTERDIIVDVTSGDAGAPGANGRPGKGGAGGRGGRHKSCRRIHYDTRW
jgi:hypothetical protein